MKIQQVIAVLEDFAPLAYQESYDNSGLITGNPNLVLTNVLVTLDCTEAVVEEAISKGCNLIVAHHPIVFKGIKKLNGKNYVERTIIAAIKNDIAIYAVHTNLDNVRLGVNKKICERLGLVNTKILSPKKGLLTKLSTFIPRENTEEVLKSLYKAGAGEIGNYDHCSFKTTGEGSFRPSNEANPHIGTAGIEERADENKVELLMPTHLERKVIGALKASHPYEEVAYYLSRLENENQDIGSGMVGELEEPVSYDVFFKKLGKDMRLSMFRHTATLENKVSKVAVCGGAGSFLLQKAISCKADIYISSDFKYHEFFDAEHSIVIADIGHYESEVYTKDLICEILREKLSNIALILSELDTNPIKYYKV